MAEKIFKNRLVILLLLTGAVYFFLKVIAPLTAPLLIAMLFVTVFGPLLQKLQSRLHIHRQVGAMLLMVIACLFLGLLVWVLFSWIVGSLPSLADGLDALEKGLSVGVHNICDTVGRAIGVDGVYLEETILSQIQDGIGYFKQKILPGVLSQSLEYIKMLAAFGGFLLIFLIATVLMAKDYDDIMNRLLDREEYHVFLEIICGIIRYIATYIKAQLIIMNIVGALAAATLGVCGIRHGILWGLLAGILDAFPFIGTGVVLVPLGIQQLFLGSYGRAAGCLLLYVVCVVIRQILEPKLIGQRVGVPPIAILLALYAGIRLFGVWGILEGPLGFVIIYQSYLSLERRLNGVKLIDEKEQVDYYDDRSFKMEERGK